VYSVSKLKKENNTFTTNYSAFIHDLGVTKEKYRTQAWGCSSVRLNGGKFALCTQTLSVFDAPHHKNRKIKLEKSDKPENIKPKN
jgi:hypothetical protein